MPWIHLDSLETHIFSIPAGSEMHCLVDGAYSVAIRSFLASSGQIYEVAVAGPAVARAAIFGGDTPLDRDGVRAGIYHR